MPKIIYNDDDLLVVDKPTGIPVHSAGGQHFNSLLMLLKHDLGIKENLYLLHRIDKGTSGVLIISKNPDINTRFT